MKRPRSLSIFASLLCLVTSCAFADDFNFTVPVSFNNLPPDVHGAQIECDVYQTTYGVQVGGGHTQFAIVGGAYHGDVSVHFNATPGRDPASGQFYNCAASIFFGTSGTQYVFGSPTEPSFPLQPGAPVVLQTGNQPLRP